MTKHRGKSSHSKTKENRCYSDLEGNLEKIKRKPLFSCNKEIYVAKEFKENALASGAKHEVWCRKPLTNPLI